MDKKICTKCGIEKSFSEFHKDPKKKFGLYSSCRDCCAKTKLENGEKIRAYNMEYYKRNRAEIRIRNKKWNLTANGIFSSLKKRAQLIGQGEIINKEKFVAWYEKEPKLCHYCGILVDDLNRYSMIDEYHNRRLTIDRMDNTLGYVEKNLVLSCQGCNMVKGKYLTYEEMKRVVGPLMKVKWEKELNGAN